MKGQHHQILWQLSELAGGKFLARLQHDLQPQREAIGIERLVFARPFAVPQVVVENPPQLIGRGERHKLARIFEPNVVDDFAKRRRRQGLNRSNEVGLVEQAVEELSRRHVSRGQGRHGATIGPAAGPKCKQDLRPLPVPVVHKRSGHGRD